MADVSGFVKAKGRKLVNGEGREILLRGVGLGGWLLPEGYMWCLPDRWDRPRRIEQMISDLIGEEKSKKFWEIYFERYISEADICKIAMEGFNSVRVPINARLLYEEKGIGRYNEFYLNLIDRLIEWCRTNHLYVILDLHAAPGGQTGANIDDSENDRPDLFLNDENKRLTVDLWRMLAERYKDEWIVAGFDLLNEPLPRLFSAYNNKVMPLYKEIVKAIREVDKQHMIILEGVHWATDWSIFTEKVDENLMLQFHKYWNNPDTESIRVYLDKREEWNVPIFMGEGGENNKEWYAGVFRLLEDNEISWSFWTWKKMDTNNSPCSINKPCQWDKLVNYLKGNDSLDNKTAERILWEYLDNILFERCSYYPDVVNSIFRRPPVRIPCIFYGYKGEGISFGITKKSCNNMGFRVGDGTNLLFVDGMRTKPNFNHGRGEAWQPDEWIYVKLATGEWLAYDFRVESFSELSGIVINLCASTSEENGQVSVLVNGIMIGEQNVNSKSWEIFQFKKDFRLDAGLHKIVLQPKKGSICVKWLEIILY